MSKTQELQLVAYADLREAEAAAAAVPEFSFDFTLVPKEAPVAVKKSKKSVLEGFPRDYKVPIDQSKRRTLSKALVKAASPLRTAYPTCTLQSSMQSDHESSVTFGDEAGRGFQVTATLNARGSWVTIDHKVW